MSPEYYDKLHRKIEEDLLGPPSFDDTCADDDSLLPNYYHRGPCSAPVLPKK